PDANKRPSERTAQSSDDRLHRQTKTGQKRASFKSFTSSQGGALLGVAQLECLRTSAQNHPAPAIDYGPTNALQGTASPYIPHLEAAGRKPEPRRTSRSAAPCII
ncbi:hypothetical protein QWJ46_26205, partial [Rhizobium sp. CBN3]|uniref:hypothetical protein n=1 Tax=Rhizobium sp. CBN3 TaxID=3058045 RepID=UPI002673B6CB